MLVVHLLLLSLMSLHGNEWCHFLCLCLCSVCHTVDGTVAAFYHLCTALSHIKGFQSFHHRSCFGCHFLLLYLYTPFSKRTLLVFHFIPETKHFFIFSWKTQVGLFFSSSFMHSSPCVLLFRTFSHSPSMALCISPIFFILTPFVIVSSYTACSAAFAYQSLYRPHPTILYLR